MTTDLKGEGNPLFHIGHIGRGMGGSLYLRRKGVQVGMVPDVDIQHLRTMSELVVTAIEKGLVLACHDISDGGLAGSLAEMCIGGGMGARISLSELGEGTSSVKLFSESNTRWLMEAESGKEQELIDPGLIDGAAGGGLSVAVEGLRAIGQQRHKHVDEDVGRTSVEGHRLRLLVTDGRQIGHIADAAQVLDRAVACLVATEQPIDIGHQGSALAARGNIARAGRITA